MVSLVVCYSVGYLVGWLDSWLAGWLVIWLAGWLVTWLVGWLTCLVDYSEEGSAEKNEKLVAFCIKGITHDAYRTA